MSDNSRAFNILSLILALVLSACTGAGPPGPDAGVEAVGDPEPGAEADPPAPSPEPGDLQGAEVVLYSGRSQSLVDPIIDRYQERTGADLAVRWGKTAEVAATLLEEGDASPADVFYAQDPGGLGAVSHRLTPLPNHILEIVDPRFRDPEGRWVGISGRARVVVYNTEAVDPSDLPEDLWGFTQPTWQGRMGWAPTNASFQTMVTAMRSVWGEQDSRAWLEGILANDPIIYDSNTPIVAAVGAGEIDVGFVNHYYLYRFLSEEGEAFSARNYFLPGGGPGSLVMVSGAGVLESSDNKEAALSLLEFLLSPEAQSYFADQTSEYPLREGVASAPELTPLEELNAVDVRLSNLADLEGTLELLREVGALP